MTNIKIIHARIQFSAPPMAVVKMHFKSRCIMPCGLYRGHAYTCPYILRNARISLELDYVSCFNSVSIHRPQTSLLRRMHNQTKAILTQACNGGRVELRAETKPRHVTCWYASIPSSPACDIHDGTPSSHSSLRSPAPRLSI